QQERCHGCRNYAEQHARELCHQECEHASQQRAGTLKSMAQQEAGHEPHNNADDHIFKPAWLVALAEADWRGLCPGVGTFDCAEDGLDSGGDAARQISTSKTGHNFLSNNVCGTEICECAFEGVAAFDCKY